ncbi:hypothetical protein L0664_00295 [Octadecabacter sp. G9-8]|uniref:Bromoperoxidase n=1 Tax=Octadecabacter dasysiphoniae TaxID=2909341 RepID=A0ABS9CSW5_9RHOB|nr:hypothetical protein [Octadecabacter dasysiphoniae]MCF2869489.1 hypothetical protein [Octadecabacter dasysiphoniae]
MSLDDKTTRPTLDGVDRIDEAIERRAAMTRVSAKRPLRSVTSNKEEQLYSKAQPSNFTKGLEHNDYGLVEREQYEAFVKDLTSPNPKMDGPQHTGGRRWESPLAGHYFENEGPDPAQFTMAPAPKLGDSELCFEMASVYVMALLRDVSFSDLSNPEFKTEWVYPDGHPKAGQNATIQDFVDELGKLSWANPNETPRGFNSGFLTDHEVRRRTALWGSAGQLDVGTVFRGSTAGAKTGPYLSQFLLLGTGDRAGNTGNILNGLITYGVQTIDQRIARNTAKIDFMQTWEDWLAVQNGVDAKFTDEHWRDCKGLMATPRDLATYVHFDQLYQAYLNAGMMIDIQGGKVDRGAPIQGVPEEVDGVPKDSKRGDTSQGFATWGGPHMLSLVTEVASRGLRAVRRQKFQLHRRARPEVLAARLAQVHAGAHNGIDKGAVEQIKLMLGELGAGKPADDTKPGVILHWINQINAAPLTIAGTDHADANFLLPMAFAEGSPMHPAYGAGHATVAGACVTILKAFYDKGETMKGLFGLDTFYQTNPHMDGLVSAGAMPQDTLVSDELDKLAANIAIGRNWAGVHYYTDYYDSLRLGERIAAGVLEEQMLTYNEPVSLTFKDFDGHEVEIAFKGGKGDTPTLTSSDGGDWWSRPVEGFYDTLVAAADDTPLD